MPHKNVLIISLLFSTLAIAQTCPKYVGGILNHLKTPGHKGVYGSAGILDGMGTNWSYGKVSVFFGSAVAIGELKLNMGQNVTNYFILTDGKVFYMNRQGDPGNKGYQTNKLSCYLKGDNVIIEATVKLHGKKSPMRLILDPWIVH